MDFVFKSLDKLRDVEWKIGIVQERKLGDGKHADSLVAELSVEQSKSVFGFAVFGLVRGVDKVVAHCGFLLFGEVNTSDEHCNIDNEMAILLNQVPVIVFVILFERERMDNFLNLLDLSCFVLSLQNYRLPVIWNHWISWYRIIMSLWQLCNPFKLINVISYINNLSWPILVSLIDTKSTSSRKINSKIPENLGVIFGHLYNYIEIILEVSLDIALVLVLVALRHADVSLIELLQRPS